MSRASTEDLYAHTAADNAFHAGIYEQASRPKLSALIADLRQAGAAYHRTARICGREEIADASASEDDDGRGHLTSVVGADARRVGAPGPRGPRGARDGPRGGHPPDRACARDPSPLRERGRLPARHR